MTTRRHVDLIRVMKTRVLLTIACSLAVGASASAAPAPAIIQQIGAGALRTATFMERLDVDSCETVSCINTAGRRIVGFAAKEDAVLRAQWKRSSPAVRAVPCIGGIYRRALQLNGVLGSLGKSFTRLDDRSTNAELVAVQARGTRYKSLADQLVDKVQACSKIA